MVNETGSARFRPNPDTVAEPLGNDLVLVHMKTDRILLLQGTGVRIWELLSTGHDVAEIRARILREFEATETEVATDIDDLLASLQREQLISPDD